jgi:hypothetical protein
MFVNVLFKQLAKIEMWGFYLIIYDIWVSLLVFPLFILKPRALLFHVEMANKVTIYLFWKGRGQCKFTRKKKYIGYQHTIT